MYRNNVSIIIISILLLFQAGRDAYSQENKNKNKERLLSSWNIAILGVLTENYDTMDTLSKTTSLSVVPLLQTLIKEVDVRLLSTQELFLARELLRDRALNVLEAELIKKQDTLNKKNFIEKDTLDIWNNRRLKEKSISEIKSRIKKITALENDDIPVNINLPIKLIENNDKYTIQSSSDFERIATTLNAQELFYYTVEPLNRFVVITLYLYHHLFKKTEKILQTVVESTDVQQLFNNIEQLVKTTILGTPSASLKIKALDTDSQTALTQAKILLDGKLVGFGEVYLSTIPSGSHAIRVQYGEQQRQEVLIIKDLERISRTFLFSSTSKNTITILTKPTNAKVYINSEWVGNSPVSIPRSSLAQQMEVTLPKHASKRLTLNYLSPKIVRFTLKKANEISLEERLKKERNDFYTAFTVVGFSLIPSLLLYGFYNNEAISLQSAKNSISPAGRQESINRRDSYFYSAIGSSLLTASAIIWFSFEMADYIRVGSEFHER